MSVILAGCRQPYERPEIGAYLAVDARIAKDWLPPVSDVYRAQRDLRL
jgi:hypothetical protein